MRYYKAHEQDKKPGLVFDLIAESLEELEAIGMTKDPLVVDEDRLINTENEQYISYEYGICHKRIYNGALADRPSAEITAQQAALGAATEVLKTHALADNLKVSTFTFSSKEFPLTSAARSVYQAVIESTPASTPLVTTTGNYNLSKADIDVFKAVYYGAILKINTTASA